ncbi:sensor histidine kinase [Nocardia pseudobrasiliensis]|uniref:histidine kinase n=1 Tax=Nocardia pseudobrasiliensis TaxID=45979 RepID=A0A370IGN2_9NOCA|nr:histidine kinase [Nocardia pseudobrasiliensis]RDI68594.1 signal transduction histidine kinase [Nocardia pseudobrasiliensis]
MIAAPYTPTRLSRLLRLVGFVTVVGWSVNQSLWQHPWLVVGAVISWIGWAGFVLTPTGARIFLCAMAIGGGLTVDQLIGSKITVLATVFVALSLATEPVLICLGIAALTVLCSCVSIAATPDPPRALLGLLLGLGVSGVMGWSRRQSRISAEQNRLLVEQNRMIRVERDRAAALAERGRIARDMHDVLAHTLGGLVLQLDAADALLEAGEVDRATERVKASHRLAASGLEDARRVVGALRADDFDLSVELQRLYDEYRGAGGQLEIRTDAELRGSDQQVAVALARAVQEALTNARKHAPGQPVTLTIRDEAAQLVVTASNPLAAQRITLAASGAGAGLLGMRERIAASGGTVEAGKENGRWTIRIRVPRR